MELLHKYEDSYDLSIWLSFPSPLQLAQTI